MTHPVVFVPGLPASELWRRRVQGEKLFLRLPPPVERLFGPDALDVGDEVVAGNPVGKVKIGFLDLAKFAESLYDVLQRLGVRRIERVGWDWRRPVWDEHPDQVQERIGRAIDDAFNRQGPVMLILHSTGGLAGRWFLEHADGAMREKIAAVVAFGVPWVGTLDSLEPLIGERGFAFTSRQDVQQIIGHSWAAFDLLPPDPARIPDALYGAARLVVGPAADADGRPKVSSPLVERAWIDTTAPTAKLRAAMAQRCAATDDRLGARLPTLTGIGAEIPTVVFAGWGARTLRQAVLTPAGRVELSRQVDGQETPLDDGDGTVPRISAAWLRGANVRRFHVPVGRYPEGGNDKHSRLWENPSAVSVVGALLKDQPIPPQAEAAMDWSDFVETSNEVVTIRCQVSDGDGNVPAGARVRLRLGRGITDWQPVDPAFGGRHRLQVERDAVPAFGREFRRLVVEIDLALGDEPKRIPLLCRR